MRANEFELTGRKPGEDLALRANDLPQVQDFLFDLDNLVKGPLGWALHNLLFESANFQRQLFQSRFVVLYDSIEQSVSDAIGRARDMHRSAQAPFFGRLDASQRHVVIRYEKILPEKKIQFTGGKDPVFAAVVHGVNDHKEIR